MVRYAGHAYPWDVVGDPAFPGRVRDLGLDTVTMAAAYHSTRAATPLHPRHQVVDAPYAALYRPVRPSVWPAERRLRPERPQWMDDADPFGLAAARLRDAGLKVNAWIVLTHNTRLGTAFPELAVTNCFGERYPYALCPANPEVREYAALLAAEALRDAPVDGVSLEACGQLGLVHLSHHEKTDDAWTPDAVRLLSVCCCAACRAGWTERGLAPDAIEAALRAGVRGGPRADAMDKETEAALLAVRHEAADALRAQVLDAVRQTAPDAPVTLHASPDPWATGAAPGLTASAAKDVDALLVPAWPVTTASAQAVGRAVAAAPGTPVDAYVTVLPPAPAEPDALVDHVRRIIAAGASRLSLYHLGLAPHWRQELFTHILTATEGDSHD